MMQSVARSLATAWRPPVVAGLALAACGCVEPDRVSMDARFLKYDRLALASYGQRDPAWASRVTSLLHARWKEIFGQTLQNEEHVRSAAGKSTVDASPETCRKLRTMFGVDGIIRATFQPPEHGQPGFFQIEVVDTQNGDITASVLVHTSGTSSGSRRAGAGPTERDVEKALLQLKEAVERVRKQQQRLRTSAREGVTPRRVVRTRSTRPASLPV